MEQLVYRSCLAVVTLGLATGQSFQVLGTTVVDDSFFVVGELRPDETLQQFTRRHRNDNHELLAPLSDTNTLSLDGRRIVPTALSSGEPLGLSAGASEVIGDVAESFSCQGLPYGYYADPENNCRVYHICNPIGGGDLRGGFTLQYSFFCNIGMEFDQELLTCMRVGASRSSKCGSVSRLYESSNSQFFREVNFNDGEEASVGGKSFGDNAGPIIEIGVGEGVDASVLQSTASATPAVLGESQRPMFDPATFLSKFGVDAVQTQARLPQDGSFDSSFDTSIDSSMDGAGLLDLRTSLAPSISRAAAPLI